MTNSDDPIQAKVEEAEKIGIEFSIFFSEKQKEDKRYIWNMSLAYGEFCLKRESALREELEAKKDQAIRLKQLLEKAEILLSKFLRLMELEVQLEEFDCPHAEPPCGCEKLRLNMSQNYLKRREEVITLLKAENGGAQ